MLPISYDHLKLNNSVKTDEGFDEPILNHIKRLLSYSLISHKEPILAHIVIQAPNSLLFKRLGLEVTRWYSQRKPNSECKPLWISVYEKSKSKGKHMHLAVIADEIAYVDLLLLAERLCKYSDKGYSKIQKRLRPYKTDAYGVIAKNSDGALLRKGHTHFHNVRKEFDDAFERISYLAKNHTKCLIPARKTNYQVSRYKELTDSAN